MPCNPIDVRPQDVNLPMVVDVPKEESLILSRVFAVAIAVLCFCNGALHLALSGVKIVVLPIAYLTSTQEECGRLFDEAVSHFLSSVPDAGRGGLYVFVALVSPRTVFSHWEERRAIGQKNGAPEIQMQDPPSDAPVVVAVVVADPATTSQEKSPSAVSESETRTPEPAKIEVRSSDSDTVSDTREKVSEPVVLVQTVVEVLVTEEPKPKPPVVEQETPRQAEPAPQVEQQVVVQQVASVTVTGTTSSVSATQAPSTPVVREEQKQEINPLDLLPITPQEKTDIPKMLHSLVKHDIPTEARTIGLSLKLPTIKLLAHIFSDATLRQQLVNVLNRKGLLPVASKFRSDTESALATWRDKNDKDLRFFNAFCAKLDITGQLKDALRKCYIAKNCAGFIQCLLTKQWSANGQSHTSRQS